ncbi:MAG: adenine deaminase [Synergistaceae bacterium]|nr:adenine deaminase [Synergistaceae bacterium]
MIKFAAVARGDLQADTIIHNANIANIFTQNYELADIAIYSGKIAGIGKYSDAKTHFDAQGRALIPGMIDGHIHIEDTMMTPANFADIAALHGTSAVMADPHEISNALGVNGLEYMFAASRSLPIDIFFGAPSCVPASEFETPFQELDMNSIKNFFDTALTQHLGEMMNYPAVINGDPEAWGKILAAGNRPLTGHAPGVSGKNLNAYMCSGIDSDHECTNLDEAREKLSRGMWLMIREGAAFPDLKTLLPLIRENPLNAARCMVVSDDITARYLLERGHMDEKMRIMCRENINPFTALRLLTLSPAEYFRLYDRGLIAPGKLADFAILEDKEINQDFSVKYVWKNGRLIVKDGDIFTMNEDLHLAPAIKTRITNIPTLEQIKLDINNKIIRAIGITQGSIITKSLEIDTSQGKNLVDLAKIIVLERHNNTGRFGVGFVKGLGIKTGAIGSSVAHDAHNFVVAGADDKSIITALNELANMGGGLVLTQGDNVINSFALPIGGLMSYLKAEQVASELTKMEDTAKNLGVEIPHPFMVLSFLCLSVIGELRITDLGYIDITKGGRQDLFVN